MNVLLDDGSIELVQSEGLTKPPKVTILLDVYKFLQLASIRTV